MCQIDFVTFFLLIFCFDHLGPSQGFPAGDKETVFLAKHNSRDVDFSHCDVNLKQYALLANGACPAGSDWSADIACCVGCNFCRAGTRKQGSKCHSPCVQCEEGTYSNASNINNLECTPCTKCEVFNRAYNHECTLKQDAQCGECLKGFYYNTPAPVDIMPGTRPDPGDGTVLGCHKCKPGITTRNCRIDRIETTVEKLHREGNPKSPVVAVSVSLSIIALLAVVAVIIYLIWGRKRDARRSQSPVKYCPKPGDASQAVLLENSANENKEDVYKPQQTDAQTSITRTWENPSEEGGGAEVATSIATPPSSKLDIQKQEADETSGTKPLKSILKSAKGDGSSESSSEEYQGQGQDQFYSLQPYRSLPESVTDASEYQTSASPEKEEFKSLNPSDD